jgi:hypothetical protein
MWPGGPVTLGKCHANDASAPIGTMIGAAGARDPAHGPIQFKELMTAGATGPHN